MLDEIYRAAAPYITPLHMNGLNGRVLRHPTRNKRYTKEIVVIYGVHASLERNWGVVRFLARYGNVTMPDLPGFGGMSPFYAVGMKPTIDNYADYLAAFIKLRYRNKKCTIAGISFGFVVVTRMLQRYPELRGKVDLLVSIVGLSGHDNFSFSLFHRYLYEAVFIICRAPGLRWVLSRVILRRPLFAFAYRRSPKMAQFSNEERTGMIDFETILWRNNDIRTYGSVMHQLFRLRQPSIVVPMKLHHIGVAADQWLDDTRVQLRLREQYQAVVSYTTPMQNHGASLVGDEKEAADLVPPTLLKLLRSTSKEKAL